MIPTYPHISLISEIPLTLLQTLRMKSFCTFATPEVGSRFLVHSGIATNLTHGASLAHPVLLCLCTLGQFLLWKTERMEGLTATI
jgi:hypothetical protein